MTDTPALVVQANGRRSDLPELRLSRFWSARRLPMIRCLKKMAPHVIGVQEFTKTMVTDVLYKPDGLGESWTHIGQEHNVRLFVDTRFFTPVNDTAHYLVMPSDLRKRYALFAQLESRATGEVAWFASIHLAAGGITERNETELRHSQMQRIGEHIKTLPGPREKLIVCGDLNSKTHQDPASLKTGTRGVADDYGLLCLRRRLSAGDIKGESYESKHDWMKTETNYEWLDDILTLPAIKPVRAALWRTSLDIAKTAYGGHVSDHNWILMEAVI